jgi:hypothetical protein
VDVLSSSLDKEEIRQAKEEIVAAVSDTQ